MKYMVVETFKPGAKDAVYERFERLGRQLPTGLNYLDSGLTQDRTKCFQLMETEDAQLFDEWIGKWSDLVDFKTVPVNDSPTKRQTKAARSADD